MQTVKPFDSKYQNEEKFKDNDVDIIAVYTQLTHYKLVFGQMCEASDPLKMVEKSHTFVSIKDSSGQYHNFSWEV